MIHIVIHKDEQIIAEGHFERHARLAGCRSTLWDGVMVPHGAQRLNNIIYLPCRHAPRYIAALLVSSTVSAAWALQRPQSDWWSRNLSQSATFLHDRVPVRIAQTSPRLSKVWKPTTPRGWGSLKHFWKERVDKEDAGCTRCIIMKWRYCISA